MSFALQEPENLVHRKHDELGRSYTPRQVADAIVARLALRLPVSPRVLEPCVGGGAFASSVLAAALGTPYIVGVDIDPNAGGRRVAHEFICGDFANVRLPGELFDLAITNPPFGRQIGQEATLGIVRRARMFSRWCAMLMPLDYQTQTGFEEDVGTCAEVWPLLPRPFAHERGMCVFVWGPMPSIVTHFRPLRWKNA